MAEMPQPQKSVDFFISYTQVDRRWAEWIAWQLEVAGYSTRIQAWDFRPGNNFVELMDQATTVSDRTIAVLSPDYLTSGFSRAEWQAAFAQDPTGEQGKLLPIRVRDCDPVGLLSQIVYIDLLDLDASDAKDVLLAGVRTDRSKLPEYPGFPGPAPLFPGALPPIWNVPVPYLRNRHFTGREGLLTALRQGLIDSEATVLTQAISGLGGVGKTQLALEYIYRHANEYALVWWVRAENTLLTDYVQLAHALNLPEREAQEAEVVVEAVRHWLASHRNWLLVFDNVSRPEDIEPYLQQGRTGHMLITSRHQDWSARANEVPVNVFTREESLAYLRRRTGQDDDETADALAEELGDLPLALSQAAAYLSATGTTMRDYLPLLRERRLELWGEEEAPPDYPKTVGATWSLSIEEMAKESPKTVDLLRLMAFLAPDPVARDWLSEGFEHLPEALRELVTDQLVWNRSLRVFRRYGLVEVNEGELQVHRLVQAVTRDRLDKVTASQWAAVAVALVDDAFPSINPWGDPSTWAKCVLLLSHSQAATKHATDCQVNLETTANLLIKTGLYLRGTGRYTEAEELYQHGLAILQQILGSEHLKIVTGFNNLAALYQVQSQFAKAEPFFQRALEIREKALKPEDPLVATSLNNLATLYGAQGRYAEAEPLYQRALTILKQVWGCEHLNVTIGLNNLATNCEDQGRYAEAEPLYQRALAIREKNLEPDHIDIALSLNNLGDYYRGQNQYEEAEPLLKRALAIREKKLGPEHPLVATSLANLGGLYYVQGRYEEAEPLFKRALVIREKKLGPKHSHTATSLINLGALLHAQGDLAGARSYFERALHICYSCVGKDHFLTQNVLAKLTALEADEVKKDES